MDELIVFLMREFGWTLEYTTGLVNNLEIGKLLALVREARFQRTEEDYRTARNFAMQLANWASSHGKRKYRISEFIGNPPKRESQEGPDLRLVAARQGIKVPEGGI